MVLVVDAGNTRLCLALYKNDFIYAKVDILRKSFSEKTFASMIEKLLEEKDISPSDIKDALICSVVPKSNKKMVSAIKKVLSIEAKIMNISMYKDLKHSIDDLNEVGGDLVADIIAADRGYKLPCLVIDLGTVTKNIVIDEKGTFVGVSFYPGFYTSFEAMTLKAELLPKIKDFHAPLTIVGKNTEQAMKSGVYYATLGSIKEMGIAMKKKYGENSTLVLTGGYAKYFKNDASEFITDEDLTLRGIYQIYKENFRG